jgi:hypothetical protein
VSFLEDDQCRDRVQHATRSMFVNLNECLIRPLLPAVNAVGRNNMGLGIDKDGEVRRRSGIIDSAIVYSGFVFQL